MAACSVRSDCVLYLVVVSIVVLSQAILCSVVRVSSISCEYCSFVPSYLVLFSVFTNRSNISSHDDHACECFRMAKDLTAKVYSFGI